MDRYTHLFEDCRLECIPEGIAKDHLALLFCLSGEICFGNRFFDGTILSFSGTSVPSLLTPLYARFTVMKMTNT